MEENWQPLVREVRADLACRECSYNLRGLRFDQSCPECGTAVEWTTHGHQLRFASIRWLRNLHRGTRLIIAATIIHVITTIWGGLTTIIPLFGLTGELILLALIQASVVVAIFGIIQITTVEPRIAAIESLVSSRRLTRFCCALTAASFGIFALAQLSKTIPASFFFSHIAHWIAMATWLILMAMLLHSLKNLAIRSSYFGMTRRINGVGAALVLLFAQHVVAAFSTFSGDNSIPWSCLICGGSVIAWLFFTGLLLILSELSSELHTAIRISASRPWVAPSVVSSAFTAGKSAAAASSDTHSKEQ